ncbi:MAG: hypothetical protein AAGG48_17955 [Planctomycetota bacterium]
MDKRASRTPFLVFQRRGIVVTSLRSLSLVLLVLSGPTRTVKSEEYHWYRDLGSIQKRYCEVELSQFDLKRNKLYSLRWLTSSGTADELEEERGLRWLIEWDLETLQQRQRHVIGNQFDSGFSVGSSDSSGGFVMHPQISSSNEAIRRFAGKPDLEPTGNIYHLALNADRVETHRLPGDASAVFMAVHVNRDGRKISTIAEADGLKFHSQVQVKPTRPGFGPRGPRWEWQTKKKTSAFDASKFRACRFTSDGKRVVGLTKGSPAEVHVWDVAEDRVIARIERVMPPRKQAPRNLRGRANGRGVNEGTPKESPQALHQAISENGRWFAFSVLGPQGNSWLSVVDLAQTSVAYKGPIQGAVTSISLAGSTPYLAYIAEGNAVVVDLETKASRPLKVPNRKWVHGSISQDGSLLATAEASGPICLHRLQLPSEERWHNVVDRASHLGGDDALVAASHLPVWVRRGDAKPQPHFLVHLTPTHAFLKTTSGALLPPIAAERISKDGDRIEIRAAEGGQVWKSDPADGQFNGPRVPAKTLPPVPDPRPVDAKEELIALAIAARSHMHALAACTPETDTRELKLIVFDATQKQDRCRALGKVASGFSGLFEQIAETADSVTNCLNEERKLRSEINRLVLEYEQSKVRSSQAQVAFLAEGLAAFAAKQFSTIRLNTTQKREGNAIIQYYVEFDLLPPGWVEDRIYQAHASALNSLALQQQIATLANVEKHSTTERLTTVLQKRFDHLAALRTQWVTVNERVQSPVSPPTWLERIADADVLDAIRTEVQTLRHDAPCASALLMADQISLEMSDPKTKSSECFHAAQKIWKAVEQLPPDPAWDPDRVRLYHRAATLILRGIREQSQKRRFTDVYHVMSPYAVTMLERAEQLDVKQTHNSLRKSKVYALAYAGQLHNALLTARKLVEQSPEDAGGRVLFARTLAALGAKTRAMDEIEGAIFEQGYKRVSTLKGLKEFAGTGDRFDLLTNSRFVVKRGGWSQTIEIQNTSYIPVHDLQIEVLKEGGKSDKHFVSDLSAGSSVAFKAIAPQKIRISSRYFDTRTLTLEP